MAVEGTPGEAEAVKGSTRPKKESSKVFMTPVLFSCICIILVAGGWVPKEDIVFSILTSIYIVFMNRKVFPAGTSSVIRGMFPGKLFLNYLKAMTVLGLFLPLLYLLGAYIQGDMTGFRAAVPSQFLLLAQVLSENYTYTKPSFSLMIRALVPIMYNTRRIFTLWSWMLILFGNGVDPAFSTGYWLLCGQILAVVNVIVWNYNLWCFLLPIFLPGSMRQYHEVEQKLRS